MFSNTGPWRKALTPNRTWWISGCRPCVYFSGSHRNALGDAQRLNIDHLSSRVIFSALATDQILAKIQNKAATLQNPRHEACTQQLKVCLSKWDLIDMNTCGITAQVLQKIQVPLFITFGQAELRKSFLNRDSLLFVCHKWDGIKEAVGVFPLSKMTSTNTIKNYLKKKTKITKESFNWIRI